MMDTSCKRVCVWSGPRNISTALMYSFAQRNDTRVVDEPLYGHYLRVTGADHPDPDRIMASMCCDGERVIREQILGEWNRPVVFFKSMAHHLVEIDWGFMDQTINVVLTRDPLDMLPSLAKVIDDPSLRDTGYSVLSGIMERTIANRMTPIVLDSRELLRDPPGVLTQLCRMIGIDFDPAMLEWPVGPRPEDGVWAEHWYQNVHRSSGFSRYRSRSGMFPQALRPLLEQCQPYYEQLAQQAIKASAYFKQHGSNDES